LSFRIEIVSIATVAMFQHFNTSIICLHHRGYFYEVSPSLEKTFATIVKIKKIPFCFHGEHQSSFGSKAYPYTS
jgi:hypothetical protein